MIALCPDITSVPESLRPELGEALFVVKDGWEIDLVGTAGRTLPWSTFESEYKRYSDGEKAIVLVGLSKIRNPSNRANLVWGFLHNHRPDIHKVSIDRTLFVAEPWRAFFQFYWVHATYGVYTYSYLAESHWKASQEGIREDPFSLSEILEKGSHLLAGTESSFFTTFDHEVIETDEATKEAYQVEKAKAFDEEHTLAGILGRLSAFAKAAVPERSIPTKGRLFDCRKWNLVTSDLLVDKFLVGQLRELVDLTNGIQRAAYEHHRI